MNTTVRSDSFHVVGEQVAATLHDAHVALEGYAEGDLGSEGLQRCAEFLHVARGALHVIEVYGASLLAEEMESTCQYLGEGQHSEQLINEGIEALSRAMVQLPSYVERVMGGGRDIPLVLLPLLNDLRAVRGNPLLSESTLLLLNLDPPTATVQQPKHQPSGENILGLLVKLRPQFQLGLLGWIKGGDVTDDLQRMANVAEHLERAATSNEVYQLWWVVGGVLEALRADGLETSVALKRLIGQADREIKRLQEKGEAEFAANPPTDLINNLLYYIARAKEGGARCDAIRAAFNLSGFGSGDEQVEELREQLSAPSARLMKTVADAIREDLGRAKDVLDIFVRTGMQDPTELEAQVVLLQKISDTLGVLGLGALREIVQQRSQELAELVGLSDGPTEEQLVALAAALLEVEGRLDGELISQVSEAEDNEITDAEFHQVASAVLRECIVNLAHIKESITQALAQPAASIGMDDFNEQLRGISAGLMMLGRTRAVDLLNRVGRAVHKCVGSDTEEISISSLNRLADSIVSFEYYIETLKAGRKEPVYMLDNAERSLEAIEADVPFEAPVAEGPASHTRTLKIDSGQLNALPDAPVASDVQEEPQLVVSKVETAVELARKAIIKAPVLDTELGHPDLELLELFIEEARAEIVAIGRHYPVWAENQQDEEALITVRRSFHTLKGSGRMVGAALIGEYCWNIESLLNKLINKTISVSAPMLVFLADAIEALPQLLEQLEAGTEPEADFVAIAEDAVSFSESELPLRYIHVKPEKPEEELENDQALIDQDKPVSESESEGIDPVLLEILGRETAGHIAAIHKFIDGCLEGSEPFTITEDMHHACHTLHGSIMMANAVDVARLTGPVYQIVESLYHRGGGLEADEIALCQVGIDAVEQIIAHLITPEATPPDTLDIETKLTVVAERIAAVSNIVQLDAVTAELPEPGIDLTEATEDEQAEGTEPELDPEIADIFVEEAAEILEASDAALAQLAQNSNNVAPLEELQRHLHTLKGGARMAGIAVMGDFSHELESLLIRINQGGMGLDNAVNSLLQASIDELHRMREEVSTGSVAAPSAALILRLGGVAEASMSTPELLQENIDKLEPAEVIQEVVETESAALTEAEYVADIQEPELELELEPEPEPELSKAVFSEKTLLVPEPTNLGELARELTSGEVPEPSGKLPEDLLSAAQHVPDLAPRKEMARVDSAMLEELLNNAGEISISHSRMNQQVNSLQFNLEELGQTVQRLQGQLRKLEGETEAQILFRHQSEAEGDETFDPLELDRYSTIQQLSKGLAETASDVSSIKDLLQTITSDTESILLQQARTTSELQDTLMRTRMVPFEQHVPRLSRLVRQQAQESGKQVELFVEGTAGELDRQVMEKMLPPFEHMLRNAIVHGIEAPDVRIAEGKLIDAKIIISFAREGSQVLIEISDDGAGLNLDVLREKALEQGFIKPGQVVTDEEVAQLILHSGLTTADKLTQSAGRGIGMDVVVSEIAKLGGTLAIDTVPGKGSKFTVRLPYTLAITQAFIVKVGNETFALPLPSVEGVVRMSINEFSERMAQENPQVEYRGRLYRLRHLGVYLGLGAAKLATDDEYISIILVDAGKNSTALVTDETAENREIVIKPISSLLAGIRGIAGATILGDGRVVIILDAPALVRLAVGDLPVQELPLLSTDEDEGLPTLVLVVDDSITMRRVTQRLLERNGMRVITAKDGVEALEVLQDNRPEIVLLDVEMPRMDGYEFAGHVRNSEQYANLPIIMVTSRVGEKHRARAIELGVNDYLGKPYQESEMLEAMENLLGEGFNKPKVARPRH
ncbi:MAG: response regulator [Gammaproteobacteria bacterium]|nr:response regulator [Gammaproteobacteria bacterium]